MQPVQSADGLAGAVDVGAVVDRLSGQGVASSVHYNSQGCFHYVQPADFWAQADPSLSPYIPVNARTQQLTPQRILHIMDCMSAQAGAATGAASFQQAAAPVAPAQAQARSTQQRQAPVQDDEAVGQQGHEHLGHPASGAPGVFNFALVDGRDVVIMQMFDGLQPPTEGQRQA